MCVVCGWYERWWVGDAWVYGWHERWWVGDVCVGGR